MAMIRRLSRGLPKINTLCDTASHKPPLALDHSVTNDCFVFCAIYPTISEELQDAQELICWPPDDHPEDSSCDAISAAQYELSNGAGLARIFIVRAIDDKAAADHLRSYFEQHNVVPHSLVVLDVETEQRLDAPLDEVASGLTCSYYFPILFLMRDFAPRTIESLYEFCWQSISDGDANMLPIPDSESNGID